MKTMTMVYYFFLLACPCLVWAWMPPQLKRRQGEQQQRQQRQQRRQGPLLLHMSLTEKDSSSVEWNPSSSTSSLYNHEHSSQQQEQEQEAENVHIPSAGISVHDEMDQQVNQDVFVSDLQPLPGLTGVAQITSSPTVRYSLEPSRYLVALSPPTSSIRQENKEDDPAAVKEPVFWNATFCLVDVPPFSPQLVTKIKSYMGVNATLAAILVTNRDAIHYNAATAVFGVRRSDLGSWKRAFPDAAVVAYRLDIPRDCQGLITQRLDGYGPFAANDNTQNVTFVETGRPLTYDEWDFATAEKVLSGATPPPDDDDTDNNNDDDENYTPQAIRAREEGKSILAIYTPGHSFGSVSYVFPHVKVCCSGFTLPVEDARLAESEGFVDTGPALDVRGYITTSRAGMKRQMESARALVSGYYDRFAAILPSRGDPLLLGGTDEERKDDLMAIIEQYEKIGQIYESLGITSSNDIDDDNVLTP